MLKKFRFLTRMFSTAQLEFFPHSCQPTTNTSKVRDLFLRTKLFAELHALISSACKLFSVWIKNRERRDCSTRNAINNSYLSIKWTAYITIGDRYSNEGNKFISRGGVKEGCKKYLFRLYFGSCKSIDQTRSLTCGIKTARSPIKSR